MGIVTPSKFIWTALGVHPKEIASVQQALMGKKSPIRCDVDCLLLYHKALSTMDTARAANFVVDKMFNLAQNGFHVRGILDGPIRPDCKRVSWKRIADSEFAAINSYFNKQIALSLHQQYGDGIATPPSVASKIKKLNSESKACDGKIRKDVPHDLKSLLEDLIFRRLSSGKFIEGKVEEDVIESQFQADSMMGKRVLKNETDILLTIDSDQMVILGPDHFVIRSVDDSIKRKKDMELLTCDIGGCGQELYEKVKALLTRDGIKWNEMKYPLFDVQSHKLRSYVALTLGCDLWEGIGGIGHAKCYKELKSILVMKNKTMEQKENLFKLYMVKEMKKLDAKKPAHKADVNDTSRVNITEELVDTLSSAFLHEAVFDTHGDPDLPFEYCHEKPQNLAEYLAYFKKEGDDDITIVPGPPTAQCNGIKGISAPHLYLEAEGTYFCSECTVSFCRTCGFVPSKLGAVAKKKSYHEGKTQPLCFSCYKTSSVTSPPVDTPAATDMSQTANGKMKRIEEMRKELDKMNVKVYGYALPHEVEELYDHYTEHVPLYESKSFLADFPVYDSSFFHRVEKDIFYNGEIFSPDGFLTGNPKITSEHVIGITQLFADIVKYSPSGTSPYSVAVPTLIEEFCNRSRVTNEHAHKLIKSNMRHATDQRIPPITHKTASLFMHKTESGESKVGLLLDNKVPASMRDQLYHARVAFTSDSLLSCDCMCKSSGKGSAYLNDRVTCVHNCPLIYQVALELHNGLAINYLHDLAVKWQSNDIESYLATDPGRYHETKEAVLTLMKASARNEHEQIIRNAEVNQLLISEMLSEFQTTTEKVKRVTFDPPKRHELIPFCHLPVESVETRCKKMKKSDGRSTTEGNSTKSTAESHKLTAEQSISSDTKCTRNGADPNVSSRPTPPTDTKKDTIIDNLSSIKKDEDRNSDDSDDDSTLPEMVDRFASDDEDSDDDSTLPEMIDRNTESDDDDTLSTVDETDEQFFPLPDRHTSGSNDAQSSSIRSRVDTTDTSSSNDAQSSSIRGRVNTTDTSGSNDTYWIRAYNMSDEEEDMIDSAGLTDMPRGVQLNSFRTLRCEGRQIHDTDLWITDEIVNTLCSYLEDMDKEINPDSRSFIFNSYFMNILLDTDNRYNYDNVKSWDRNFPDQDIFQKLKYLFAPININSSHWALMLADMKSKCVRYIDSFGNDGKRYAEAFIRYLGDYAKEKNLPFDRDEWMTINLRDASPLQGNTYDCGIFTLVNIYLYLLGIPLVYGQNELTSSKSRRIIALSLLKGEALPPITIFRKQRHPRSQTSVQPSQKASMRPKIKDDTKALLQKMKVDAQKYSEGPSLFPEYETFVPEYSRISLLLSHLFGDETNVPKDTVGYKLIDRRKDEQHESINLSESHKQKLMRAKQKTVSRDWRKVIKTLAKEDRECQTTNLKLNTNRRVVKQKPTKTKKAYKKAREGYGKRTRRTCSFLRCPATSKNCTHSFERVPKGPKPVNKIELHSKRVREITSYYRRQLLRDIVLKRMGIKKDEGRDYRLCSNHEKELVSVSQKVLRPGTKKDLMLRFTFCVPTSDVNTTTSKDGGVLPRDRHLLNLIKRIPHTDARNLSMFALYASDIVDLWRQQQKGKGSDQLNAKVKALLDIEDEYVPRKLKISAASMSKKYKCPATNTVIRDFDMSDSEIKDRTGFESKKLLLGFIAIVCNGDTLEMIKTKFGSLTWFEEWMLYFEFMWGRSWLNQFSLAAEYGLNSVRKNAIVDMKLEKVLTCRASWPKYCTHDEDVSMRPDKWEGIVETSSRVIQHDTTGLMMQFKPSIASSQRITWNKYYRGNVAKGNIFLQLCGWMGTDNLWVGGVSDTQYMINQRIFEQQDEFATNDTDGNNEDGTTRPFTNILDRVYKLTLQAHRNGEQRVRQPVFQTTGRRFTGSETLKSASCASIRSGNERAVRKAKLSGFIRKGIRPSESPSRYDNAWLAWSFQVNFMYRSNA